MKTIKTTSFAECHSGHGKAGLFHAHEEWIVLVGLAVVLLIVAFRRK